ncbi:MAG: Rossman fold protein, TIGR00730 family [Bacteroidetes bacterium MedPE-SWsnd-G2]|nr:MAG: Rossman fold protein, TIGR00730 family [Bacteroidetes bacterium MedPE-SWsnd-G2]
MKEIKSVAVFCGSSMGNDTQIIEQASRLGEFLAKKEVKLIYGAAKIGIMGEVAKGALDHKGEVVGVIPEFLKLKEVVHHGLTELHTTNNMHERKLKIQEVSDAFITLPGGFGTFEELFEIITWSQLGLHQKPIGLLNTNGYYDALIEMLENMMKKGFLKMENFNLLLVDSSIEGLWEKLQNFEPQMVPKWLNPERS